MWPHSGFVVSAVVQGNLKVLLVILKGDLIPMVLCYVALDMILSPRNLWIYRLGFTPAF